MEFIQEKCIFHDGLYEKVIMITDGELKAINIVGDAFHPEWNYEITPAIGINHRLSEVRPTRPSKCEGI